MGYITSANSVDFQVSTMLTNLYKKSPLLVGGKINGAEAGHLWTVDGAAQFHIYYNDQYNLYYHCVWGQGGYDNGYFYIVNPLLHLVIKLIFEIRMTLLEME